MGALRSGKRYKPHFLFYNSSFDNVVVNLYARIPKNMRSINEVEVLDLGKWSGVLEKLLQFFETRPSKSSESSAFQLFQPVQRHVIFLMFHHISLPTTSPRKKT